MQTEPHCAGLIFFPTTDKYVHSPSLFYRLSSGAKTNLTHPVGVLQIRAVERVEDAHVCLLQGHHLALDLQSGVAHVQTLFTQLALAAVGWVTDVGLYPVHGRWSKQSGDGVRHGVLLC